MSEKKIRRPNTQRAGHIARRVAPNTRWSSHGVESLEPRVFLSSTGYIWGYPYGRSFTAYQIDAATGQTVNTVAASGAFTETGVYPTYFAESGNDILGYAYSKSFSVYEIDAATGQTVGTIPVSGAVDDTGVYPNYFADSGGYIWGYAYSKNFDVYQIDAATGQTVNTIAVSGAIDDTGVYPKYFAESGGYIWGYAYGKNFNVYKIDPATGQTVSTITVSGAVVENGVYPTFFAESGGYIWGYDYAKNFSVYQIDPATGDTVGTITVSGAIDEASVYPQFFAAPAATSTSVTSSSGSATYGQPVTFTASVTPSGGSDETGTVQFQIDGVDAGSPVTLSGDTATYTASSLAVGSHSIVAIYSGDGNFAGNTSQTFTQEVIAPPPTVVSVTPEDDAGNGVAAGSAARGQRSMETQIAVVFSEPVDLGSGAFTLGLVNNYGSGANNGSPDTSLSGVLGTPTNPSGDGVTWIIPIVSNGSNSYALKGTQGGISGASLDNGVYQLNVIASEVTAASGGTEMAADYVSAAWHRLFGDIDNARRVFNAEYSAFLAAYSSTYVSNGAASYNEDLDYDGDGRVFNADYAALLADFESTRIYSEPQS